MYVKVFTHICYAFHTVETELFFVIKLLKKKSDCIRTFVMVQIYLVVLIS